MTSHLEQLTSLLSVSWLYLAIFIAFNYLKSLYLFICSPEYSPQERGDFVICSLRHPQDPVSGCSANIVDWRMNEDYAEWNQKHGQKQSGERLGGTFVATVGNLLRLGQRVCSGRSIPKGRQTETILLKYSSSGLSWISNKRGTIDSFFLETEVSWLGIVFKKLIYHLCGRWIIAQRLVRTLKLQSSKKKKKNGDKIKGHRGDETTHYMHLDGETETVWGVKPDTHILSLSDSTEKSEGRAPGLAKRCQVLFLIYWNQIIKIIW